MKKKKEIDQRKMLCKNRLSKCLFMKHRRKYASDLTGPLFFGNKLFLMTLVGKALPLARFACGDFNAIPHASNVATSTVAAHNLYL